MIGRRNGSSKMNERRKGDGKKSVDEGKEEKRDG